MPLFPSSVLKIAKYSKGVRKTKRDPFSTLNPKGNRMAGFGLGGEDTYVMPTRLEVRRGKGADYDIRDTLERNEAYTRQSIDSLRSHLSRKTGKRPKPTTARRTSSIYNSPGGDLNVPSYGTMGNPLPKRELLTRARATPIARKVKADWEQRYEGKLKQVQGKDTSKRIVMRKRVKALARKRELEAKAKRGAN